MNTIFPERARLGWLALSVLLSGLCGCSGSASQVAVPAPMDNLLSESVRLGPWLRMDPTIPGVEVTVQARDRQGDFTKAFGTFRFEVYSYRDASLDHRGKQLAVWDIPLMDPQANRVHWEDIHRAYKFRLQWDGSRSGRYLMVVYFDSPFTQRLTDQRVFTPEGL